MKTIKHGSEDYESPQGAGKVLFYPRTEREREQMLESRLIKLSYFDLTAKVRLTAYADISFR